MTEYLIKKAVLEWVLHKKTWRSWDDYCEVQEAIQSGAFDADESEGTWKATAEVLGRENAQMNSEVQRLRAALERIAAVDVFDWSDETFQGCVDIAREALSTTSEPTVAERVRDKMKSLFEAWDLRGICKDSLEGYEQGVMLELIGLCEEIAGINATEKEENNA